jgi:hypothetical protein
VEVLEGKKLVNLIFSKLTARAQPQPVNHCAKDLMQTEVKSLTVMEANEGLKMSSALTLDGT